VFTIKDSGRGFSEEMKEGSLNHFLLQKIQAQVLDLR